jgi:drug/metabolite transporter (DMT)-like permease
MTGVLWAAAAGVGFGLFQSVNRAALRDLGVLESTFLQLLISAAILSAVSLVTEDVGDIAAAPPSAVVWFAVAGLIHFAVGWTLLNASQKRIGAARTSPLIATTPLFGAAVAALTLDERPEATSWIGIAVIVAGVYVVSAGRIRSKQRVGTRMESGAGPAGGVAGRLSLAAIGFGLGTAMCWAVSPVFIRLGLDRLPSPLLGVSISLLAAVAAYGVALVVRGVRIRPSTWSRGSLAWKLAAGVLVGLSTWTRWYALSVVDVAVVLGLGLLSVPTVLIVAPLISGRDVERVTVPVAAGSALVVAGALVLILQ